MTKSKLSKNQGLDFEVIYEKNDHKNVCDPYKDMFLQYKMLSLLLLSSVSLQLILGNNVVLILNGLYLVFC